MIDRDRFDVLKTKGSSTGLSDSEANELGRMMAELEGKAYSNGAQLRARSRVRRERAHRRLIGLRAHSGRHQRQDAA